MFTNFSNKVKICFGQGTKDGMITLPLTFASFYNVQLTVVRHQVGSSGWNHHSIVNYTISSFQVATADQDGYHYLCVGY